MLVLKKTPAIKTAVYLIVILAALGATAWLLFGNQRIFQSAAPAGSDLLVTEAGLAPAAAGKAGNAALDLRIFSDRKFLDLKDSAVTRTPAEIGKRDPFKPN